MSPFDTGLDTRWYTCSCLYGLSYIENASKRRKPCYLKLPGFLSTIFVLELHSCPIFLIGCYFGREYRLVLKSLMIVSPVLTTIHFHTRKQNTNNKSKRCTYGKNSVLIGRIWSEFDTTNLY